MTDEPNPYAPPSVVETEAPSGRYWYTDGVSVVAKHGATLPKVDLETGEWDLNLQAVRHVHHSNTQLLRAMLIVPAIIVATSDWDIPIPGWVFVVGVFLILRLFPGRATRPLIAWSFTESSRAKRRKLRGLAMSFFGLSPAAYFFLFTILDLKNADWVLPLIFPSFVVFLLLAAWALFDRSRLKIESASPGWLKISQLHPGALSFLRHLEETTPVLSSPTKKRRIRTAYFHRYPLRMLIGYQRNPLLVFNITLLKLLRSPSLVREVWHYSEAEKVPLENLCAPLRHAANSWLADHSGWTFVIAERLPSPAGDLVTESAVLTSPDFGHCMQLSRSWMEQRANKGITTISFLTWLADGTLVRTHDHPHLASNDPLVIHHRASGPPDRVYQAHLRHLAGRPLLPSADLPDLIARLEREGERADQDLEKRRIHGKVREIAGFALPS